VDGVWGNGTLTGTPTGSPAIVGGKLDLTGGVNKYVTYAASGNVTAALQTGAIRFRVTPNYSGTPSARQNFFSIGGVTVNSTLSVYHDSSTGYIYVSIYNSSGVAIYSGYIQAGLYWVPVSGTEYEFELNYDVTAGTIRLFINGTLWGTAVSGTGTRSAGNLSSIWIGAIRGAAPAPSNNFSIRNVLFFDTVQHTANYTPNWTNIYETIYTTDIITVPEMEYTGAGTLVEATNFVSTITGSMRFTVQVGRSGTYLYHNGSAWVASNNTYAQANTTAEILAAVATLPVDGELYVQFRIYTTGGNTQAIIDAFTITLTAQTYGLDNPTIVPTTVLRVDAISDFVATVSVAGDDLVKYSLSRDGVYYYHNGSAWVAANGTYAQTNTAAQVLANIGSFDIGYGIDVLIKMFLHSDDGTTTPSISNLQVTYDFSGDAPSTISKCIVWGYLVDSDATYSDGPVKAKLNDNIVKYKDNITVDGSEYITATINTTTGYWELELIENENMPAGTKWIFSISGETFERTVPNAASKNIYELV
jgi:hypothetical protein